MLVLSFVLAFIYWRRRGDAGWEALALLALTLLLRDVLDTVTYSYHHVPMLLALMSWEVLARRRLPVVTIAATICLELMIRVVAPGGDLYLFNTLYLAWVLPLTAYLGVVCFRPRVSAAAPA